MIKVPIEISARHLHLTQEDLEKLFGKGYELTSFKALSQKGQYAAWETLTLKGPKGIIEEVRIVGPVRKVSQIEISQTDAYHLGIEAPLRVSGDIEGTPGITLISPEGVELVLEKGVIIAQRHIHASPEDVKKYGLKDRQIVSVKVEGERSVTFHNVVVRVDPSYVWAFQLDTDEGNAAGVGRKQLFGEVIV